jgi:hypothetical protein
MSKIINVQANTILDLKYPTQKLEAILSRLQYPVAIEQLTVIQAKSLLAVVIREFLNGNLFLEEMTLIIDTLGYFFSNNKTVEKINGYTLEEITLDASEMNLYLRNDIKHFLRVFDWYFTNLLSFLKNNEALFHSLKDAQYKIPSPFESDKNQKIEKGKINLKEIRAVLSDRP